MVFSIFSPPDLHTCPLGNVSERSLDIEDEELQSSYSHITPPLEPSSQKTCTINSK